MITAGFYHGGTPGPNRKAGPRRDPAFSTARPAGGRITGLTLLAAATPVYANA